MNLNEWEKPRTRNVTLRPRDMHAAALDDIDRILDGTPAGFDEWRGLSYQFDDEAKINLTCQHGCALILDLLGDMPTQHTCNQCESTCCDDCGRRGRNCFAHTDMEDFA